MYFVVTSQQGPAWDPSKPMREQQLWPEHVTFVNGLMDDGFLLLGGPLADGRAGDDFLACSGARRRRPRLPNDGRRPGWRPRRGRAPRRGGPVGSRGCDREDVDRPLGGSGRRASVGLMEAAGIEPASADAPE